MPVTYAPPMNVNVMHVHPAAAAPPPHAAVPLRPPTDIAAMQPAYAYNGESRFERFDIESDEEWQEKRAVYKYQYGAFFFVVLCFMFFVRFIALCYVYVLRPWPALVCTLTAAAVFAFQSKWRADARNMPLPFAPLALSNQ